MSKVVRIVRSLGGCYLIQITELEDDDEESIPL